jgi:hypothetical protein
MGKHIRLVQKYAVKIFLRAALYIFAKQTGRGSLWVTANEPSPPERSHPKPDFWLDIQEQGYALVKCEHARGNVLLRKTGLDYRSAN